MIIFSKLEFQGSRLTIIYLHVIELNACMLHVITDCCGARVQTILREIYELNVNSFRELIDSENTEKHLRLFYNYYPIT